MTFTANYEIGDHYALLNMASRIELGADVDEVLSFARQQQKNQNLFCANCSKKAKEQGLEDWKIPVDPVKGQYDEERKDWKTRPYFRHEKGYSSRGRCGSGGETDKHLAAKEAISYRLKSESGCYIELGVDDRLFKGLGAEKGSKPDVYALFPNGAHLAIEVQVSYINSAGISEKVKALRENGFLNIQFYLFGQNFKDNLENRNWCHKNNVEVFHLWFTQKEKELIAHWKQEFQVSEQPQKKASSQSKTEVDDCSYFDSREVALTIQKPKLESTIKVKVDPLPKPAQHPLDARIQIRDRDLDLSKQSFCGFVVGDWLYSESDQLFRLASIERSKGLVLDAELNEYEIARCRLAISASKLPEGDLFVHIRKPGWLGVLYGVPWGSPTLRDIIWICSPGGSHDRANGYPERYAVADLFCAVN